MRFILFVFMLAFQVVFCITLTLINESYRLLFSTCILFFIKDALFDSPPLHNSNELIEMEIKSIADKREQLDRQEKQLRAQQASNDVCVLAIILRTIS